MSQEELLKHSFHICRRHPILWLLALLAGDSAGGGSFSSSGGGLTRGQRTADSGEATRQLTAVGAWLVDNWVLLAGITLLALLVALVVSCLAGAALYRGQADLAAGSPFGLRAAWSAARQSFTRLLGLRLVGSLALLGPYLLLAILTLLLYLSGGVRALPVALFIDISFLFFLGILGLLAWPVLTLASRIVVLDGRGPIAGLRAALQLVAARTGRVALTAGIAIGLGIAVGVLFGIVDTVLALPFMSGIGSAAATADPARILSATFPLLLVLVPASLFLGAVAGSFYSTYWTLSYLQLQTEARDGGLDR